MRRQSRNGETGPNEEGQIRTTLSEDRPRLQSRNPWLTERLGVSVRLGTTISWLFLCALLVGCQGTPEGEAEVEWVEESFIGPGETGGPNPEPDVGVFINPNGSDSGFTPPITCPFVFSVGANATKNVAACNPLFEYVDLVREAQTLAISFLDPNPCPRTCPFLLLYPNEDTSRNFTRLCRARAQGGNEYVVSFVGYAQCSDTNP